MKYLRFFENKEEFSYREWQRLSSYDSVKFNEEDKEFIEHMKNVIKTKLTNYQLTVEDSSITLKEEKSDSFVEITHLYQKYNGFFIKTENKMYRGGYSGKRTFYKYTTDNLKDCFKS